MAAAGSASLEVIWRAGPYAVVWKGENMPLNETETPENAPKPAEASTGKQKRGRAPAIAKADPTPKNGERSLVGLACDYLGMGKWEAASSIDTACAGLVLLVRSGISPPPTLEGQVSLLIAPRSVEPEACGDDRAKALWSDLGLCGDLEDDGPELVSEGPSGHFGRLAVVQQSFDVSTAVSGTTTAPTLLAAIRKRIIELQEVGYAVVRLPSVAKNAARHTPELASLAPGDELPAGLCITFTALKMPSLVKDQPTITGKGKLGRDLFVRAPINKKHSALIESERLLVGQRLRSTKGEEVIFRGMILAVPALQLRPRVSSGSLVDAALKILEASSPTQSSQMPRSVLDLGVGSGALLLAVLKECSEPLLGCGVDLDEEAVKTTQTNAEKVLGESASRVSTVLANFCELDFPDVRRQLNPEGYEVILCNPPYRSIEQQAAYDRSTGRFGGNAEHAKTLVAGETGMELYEGVAECLARDLADCDSDRAKRPILAEDGVLIFQVEAGAHGTLGGMAQVVASAVQTASNGRLTSTGVHVDDRGMERAIIVRRTS